MNKPRLRLSSAVVLVAFAAVVSFVVLGCDLAVTVTQRVEYFFVDLNTARDQLHTNFRTADPLDGDAIKAPAFWSVDFPVGDGTPYTYAGLDPTSPANVTATISGPPEFFGPKSITFVMVQEGMSWYIQELYLNGNPIIPTP